MTPLQGFNITLYICVIVAYIIGIWLSVREYKNDKKYYPNLFKDYTYLRYLNRYRFSNCICWYFITPFIGLLIGIGGGAAISQSMYAKIEQEHSLQPCDQCQFKKVEYKWYDKNGDEHHDAKLKWIACPTLKKWK